LTQDTSKSLVAVCTDPQKCEFTCDAGYQYNTTGGPHCSPNSGTFCGDGLVQTPNDNGENEQCDDGNTASGDGCNASCQYENCLDAFTGPSGGSCANVGADGYLLSWTPPSASWGSFQQVIRVDEEKNVVLSGCPVGSDCNVKENLTWTNSSYPVVGVLQPDTLYYNRVAALCQDLNGTVRWRDTIWNCTTATSGGVNLSGKVVDDQDAPIPGATVTVVSPPPGFMDVTGSDGKYRFEDIPVGSRAVSASRPGYRSRTVVQWLSAGENSLNFTLTDGDCQACADWESRCSVACGGVDQCGVKNVPTVCEGARPGDVLYNGSDYVTCCEGLESRPKLGQPVFGGCMDAVRKSTILRRYLGQLVSIDVYTWKPCAAS